MIKAEVLWLQRNDLTRLDYDARELVLCSLSSLAKKCSYPVKALDAFGATGIGGLQWKHHLKEKVEVTINEYDCQAVMNIKSNCEVNEMKYTALSDIENRESQESLEDPHTVEVVNGDAQVILHQRQYHFIHLDPYGTTVQFLDAAFRNIYHKGVMVITATDIATLFGKFPHISLRNYGAYITMVGYHKEMAVRLLLAAAIRSAAKANKGIEVLHSVCVEHFVQVCVRIQRGAAHADRCVTQLRKLLHCQICQQWAVCPASHMICDNMYSLLPCKCHEGTPGKTALEMGPLWFGSIFEEDHIKCLSISAKEMNLSPKVKTLLSTLELESVCSSQSANSEDIVNDEEEVININNKRTSSDDSEGNKRMKGENRDQDSDVPYFYFNLHKNFKLSGVNLPKVDKLLKFLKKEGFRASRTHFEPKAIRTNASLEQVKQTILKNCSTH